MAYWDIWEIDSRTVPPAGETASFYVGRFDGCTPSEACSNADLSEGESNPAIAWASAPVSTSEDPAL